MNLPFLKNPVTHKYCDLILNNNFGTRQADNIFRSFIDFEKEYGSEMVYKSIHKLVANTITGTFERAYNFSDKHDTDFETIISMLKNSLLHFRSEISEQLISYYKLHRKNRPLRERIMTTEPYIIFINPIKSHEITDSAHNSVFNWDLQPAKDLNKVIDQEILNKKIEDAYFLMYYLYFEYEDCNNPADWGDLLSGYARYILYNHSRFHSINLADTNYIASAFSNILKAHLE